MHIEEHVPAWWGIITVEVEGGAVDFYILRKPQENPKVNDRKKLSLLWRMELAHIQEQNNMAKYRQKSKEFVVKKILEKVPRELLREQISQELFERDYQLVEEEIRSYKKAHGGGKKL